jgi:hypothetical protein
VSPPPLFILPLHDLALLAGVHVETLRAHRRAGSPAPPRSKQEIDKWLLEYAEWRSSHGRWPGPGCKMTAEERAWQERSARALAETREYHLEVLKRRFVAAAAVEDQRTRQVQAVAARLQDAANQLALCPDRIDWARETILVEMRLITEEFARID